MKVYHVSQGGALFGDILNVDQAQKSKQLNSSFVVFPLYCGDRKSLTFHRGVCLPHIMTDADVS